MKKQMRLIGHMWHLWHICGIYGYTANVDNLANVLLILEMRLCKYCKYFKCWELKCGKGGKGGNCGNKQYGTRPPVNHLLPLLDISAQLPAFVAITYHRPKQCIQSRSFRSTERRETYSSRLFFERSRWSAINVHRRWLEHTSLAQSWPTLGPPWAHHGPTLDGKLWIRSLRRMGRDRWLIFDYWLKVVCAVNRSVSLKVDQLNSRSSSWLNSRSSSWLNRRSNS